MVISKGMVLKNYKKMSQMRYLKGVRLFRSRKKPKNIKQKLSLTFFWNFPLQSFSWPKCASYLLSIIFSDVKNYQMGENSGGSGWIHGLFLLREPSWIQGLDSFCTERIQLDYFSVKKIRPDSRPGFIFCHESSERI